MRKDGPPHFSNQTYASYGITNVLTSRRMWYAANTTLHNSLLFIYLLLITLRPCLNEIAFASIHMYWGGLEWNLN
jgi:hypothetical protein